MQDGIAFAGGDGEDGEKILVEKVFQAEPYSLPYSDNGKSK